MEKFELKNQEFIELNKLLKLIGVVDSGGMAKAIILDGEVTVNGELEYRIRKKLRKGDAVECLGQQIEIY